MRQMMSQGGQFLVRHLFRFLRVVCRTDRVFIGMLGGILPSRPGRACLRHYCQGNGTSFPVETGKVLQGDRGMAGWVAKNILHQQASGAGEGTIPVPQWRCSTWTWRLALGSSHVRWQTRKQGIAVTLHSRYDWHPHEGRITGAVHKAAAALKQRGAQSFRIAGTTVSIVPEHLKTWLARSIQPADRMYM